MPASWFISVQKAAKRLITKIILVEQILSVSLLVFEIKLFKCLFYVQSFALNRGQLQLKAIF